MIAYTSAHSTIQNDDDVGMPANTGTSRGCENNLSRLEHAAYSSQQRAFFRFCQVRERFIKQDYIAVLHAVERPGDSYSSPLTCDVHLLHSL
jgi:hypothetical protein